VILCTTRSKQRYVDSDKDLDWGIIGLPNKMNVALTRAKFGLVVIGKRDILTQDRNWKAWLDFCDRNGLVSGLDDDSERANDESQRSLTRLEKVLLANEQDMEEHPDGTPRALKGVCQEDEMWTLGMQAALYAESIDDYETETWPEEGEEVS